MVDTIFAQASARGVAGVAVIRVSGPQALAAGSALAGKIGPERTAALRRLRDPETGEVLDQAVVIAFPGPGSFTGEDVVEFQVHGSHAVSRSVLAALGRIDGLRAAEAGEFTRRALINGRLDLAQVEGLADLLAAETTAQQRLAIGLMDGVLSRRAAAWGAALVRELAFVEASIDFAEEELPDDLVVSVRARLAELARAMREEVAGGRLAERVRDGFEVALVGRPNVGKSTLLNSLAGREAALTSEVAGTTRDVLEVRMEIDGLAVTLLDMAGVREASESIEALGVERARKRAAAADLRIFLVEDAGDTSGLGVDCVDGDLEVLAKADLRAPAEGLAISGVSGEGVAELVAAIGATLGERAARSSSASHARQRDAIEAAAERIASAQAELARRNPRVELVAEDLRGAVRSLDCLVGRVDVEALLDVIFQSFCIGK